MQNGLYIFNVRGDEMLLDLRRSDLRGVVYAPFTMDGFSRRVIFFDCLPPRSRYNDTSIYSITGPGDVVITGSTFRHENANKVLS